MAYLHGVYPTEKSETAVSLSTTTQVQVVIGTAPIHMLFNRFFKVHIVSINVCIVL